METFKVKIFMPDRKRAMTKTVIASKMEIATNVIIHFVYNEVCNDKKSKKIPDYFHVLDVVSENEKEVILNLFISRMDKGKELNINLHFKRITAKKEILDGIIVSERLWKCNGFMKGEAVYVNAR